MNPKKGDPVAFLLAVVCLPIAWYRAAGQVKGCCSLQQRLVGLFGQFSLLAGGTLALGASISDYLVMNGVVAVTVAVSGLWGLLVRVEDVSVLHAHALNLLTTILGALLALSAAELPIHGLLSGRAVTLGVGASVYFVLTAMLIATAALPSTLLLSFGESSLTVPSKAMMKYMASIGAAILVVML